MLSHFSFPAARPVLGLEHHPRQSSSPAICLSRGRKAIRRAIGGSSGSSDPQASQAGAAGPSGRNNPSYAPPWALMGRMIPADRIALSAEQKQVLISSAAARLSGLDPEAFDAKLQELLLLLPDLRTRLLTLKPAILVELCSDTRGVAYKLVALREMFPDANVSMMLAKRPTLLTEAEWAGVGTAHRKLGEMFPEGGLGQMVTQQPLLLVEEVDEVVGELERLMPGGTSGRDLLRSNPDLLLSVVSNRGLSLWLMPGVDVRIMLLRNPGVVTQVQRGPGSLGPGAEFMGGTDWL